MTATAYPALTVDRDTDLTGAERGTAWFSPDRVYRYLLARRWDVMRPVMAFVMLNPSTADAFQPDPTITRCAGFARREGCGALEVVNLFALRSADPAALRNHPDPVGPGNDRVLADLAALSPVVVAAWGAHPFAADRAAAVARILAGAGVRLQSLGVTRQGRPRHPLYVRADAPLIPWEAASA